ncbi:MAG: isopentenyl phosphate kinase [Candidatus Hodarchaeales archaeon]
MSSYNKKIESTESITIIKMGGALITDDSKEFTANTIVIRDIARQIAKHLTSNSNRRFIFIHGGGSFGHVHAAKYQLNRGYDSNNAPGFVITHDAMLELNGIVRQIFAEEGIQLLVFPPLAFCIMENGRVTASFCEPIAKALKHGFIPVTFGDVAFDEKTGYKILSGDQLPSVIYESLHEISRVIFLTNVDGVYNKHPGIYKDAVLYENIDVLSLKDPAKLFEITATTEGKTRVTGEMGKKVEELIPLAKRGVECWIINSKEDRLQKLLETGSTKGTRIFRSEK